MLDRRKTERVFLRIPISVRGLNNQGDSFTEEAATVEINRDGARIGLANTLRPDSELEVTNLINHFTTILQVSERCPQSYDGLPEWSVKFLTPMHDFWGIVFEDKNPEDERGISALLTCQLCGRQELVAISHSEYETLSSRLFIPRLCPHCRIVGRWEVGSLGEGRGGQPVPIQTNPPATGDAAQQAQASEAAAESEGMATEKVAVAEPEGAERRAARRLALKVPLLVKSPTGDTEQTETSDVSKTGMSFTTGLNLVLGDLVQVTVGYGVAENPPVQATRVIWRRPEDQGSGLALVFGSSHPKADDLSRPRDRSVTCPLHLGRLPATSACAASPPACRSS